MLSRPAILLIIISLSLPSWAQKKNQPEGVPVISNNYEFCSIFELKDGEYVLKKTFDVYTPTFLRTNPKDNEIFLPGIGNEQKCVYTQESSSFVTYDNVTQAVTLVIECLSPGGEAEDRILRIHYIRKKRKIEYIFSLDVPGASDKILYHNFDDHKLAELIISRVIRF